MHTLRAYSSLFCPFTACEHIDTHTDTHTESQTQTYAQIHRVTDTQRHTHRDMHVTDIHTDIRTEAHRYIHRATDTQSHTCTCTPGHLHYHLRPWGHLSQTKGWKLLHFHCCVVPLQALGCRSFHNHQPYRARGRAEPELARGCRRLK